MSSHDLLVLVTYGLPEESAYQTAVRGGDWSVHQKIQMVIANELMDFRAWYVAMHTEEGYAPTHFESPGQVQFEEVHDDDLDERRNNVTSQMQRW